MVLVIVPVEGYNHLIWSIFMIITRKAKDKLGFTNRRCEIVNVDSSIYEKWLNVDSMVTL